MSAGQYTLNKQQIGGLHTTGHGLTVERDRTGVWVHGSMHGVLAALASLGFCAKQSDPEADFVGLLERLDDAEISMTGNGWTLHLPGVVYPEEGASV